MDLGIRVFGWSWAHLWACSKISLFAVCLTFPLSENPLTVFSMPWVNPLNLE